jgi:hypothetical protein
LIGLLEGPSSAVARGLIFRIWRADAHLCGLHRPSKAFWLWWKKHPGNLLFFLWVTPGRRASGSLKHGKKHEEYGTSVHRSSPSNFHHSFWKHTLWHVSCVAGIGVHPL